MRSFRELRNPPTWLRALLVAFALGFAVNTVAHAGHAHDSASAVAQHASCNHCVHFGALADAPRYPHDAPAALLSFRLPIPEGSLLDSRTIWLCAQPRGPPDFETR